MSSISARNSVGDLLREWRRRRRLSQLDLAGEAQVSTRHLSFVECGRACGSRDMLLRLARQLAMPPRTQNELLLAGGYAPVFSERPLDSPEMASAKATVDTLLRTHLPFPALAVDRHWTLAAANQAVGPLLEGAAAFLLEPPVNVLRLSLHPQGLAPRIDNLAEWRVHLLQRLRHQVDSSADPVLAALLDELRGYPGRASKTRLGQPLGVVVPLVIRRPDGTALSLISTTTVFGTPTDVTLAELALECFYPADQATRQALSAAG